ncbi:MAG: 16S rRNA (cytosine(1402)-N(4))-methyltransferase RsmH [Oligoflexales bacterium]|nr:16S rRNA (cytosine(1402)-N(4))-methyltransferase RsmH [Oligoflexales bacterium]
MPTFKHTTVLLHELVDALNLKAGNTAVDCTAGGGGHTSLMLEKVASSGQVFACDRDLRAIENLNKRFETQIKSKELSLLHTRFSDFDKLIPKDIPCHGIGADLGVSSPQLDESDRGFSFMHDGPLDMRMSPESMDPSAADIVASYSSEELEKIIRTLGEEPKARFVANAIVKQRELSPITSTHQLANIVAGAIHYKQKSKKHPATKTFQALRIYVNKELEEVRTLLDRAFNRLEKGGRLAIITFHSLEDRLVKDFFKEKAGKKPNQAIPRDIPLTADELHALQNIEAKIIKPFPMLPKTEEINSNPRVRSAKLRVLEKL